MKIAIIGPGNVGTALGEGFSKHGHQVVYGANDTAKHPGSKPLAEAARDADVIVLAVPHTAAKEAMESLGDVAGKTVVDATNAIKPEFAGLVFSNDTSQGEMVQNWAPKAHVVKAFNTVGFNIMENASFPEGKPVMLYCGDDAASKQKVHQLAAELGFDPVDAGPLMQARVLEPFAMLWISLAYQAGLGREIAFQLIRR